MIEVYRMDYSLCFLILLFVLLGIMLKLNNISAAAVFSFLGIFMLLSVLETIDVKFVPLIILIYYVKFDLLVLYKDFMANRVLRKIKE